jgi:hypothetical protein
MLCHYGGTIISDTNNSITYIDKNYMFLNANKGMSSEDIKQSICERLVLNYNDVEIRISLRGFLLGNISIVLY